MDAGSDGNDVGPAGVGATDAPRIPPVQQSTFFLFFRRGNARIRQSPATTATERNKTSVSTEVDGGLGTTALADRPTAARNASESGDATATTSSLSAAVARVGCGCSCFNECLSRRKGDGTGPNPGRSACNNVPGRCSTTERPAGHGRSSGNGRLRRQNEDDSAGESSSCSTGCTAGECSLRCFGHRNGGRGCRRSSPACPHVLALARS